MRIAILTFHRAYNCGAMLQAWALRHVLQTMGHVVSFPACNHVGRFPRFFFWNRLHLSHGFSRPWRVAYDLLRLLRSEIMSLGVEDYKRHKYNTFRRRNLPEVRTDVQHLQDHYDMLVFGSDQIWNIKRSRDQKIDESGYFLAETITESIPKVGYAVSIGEEGTSNEENLRTVNAARRMNALSMREEGACVNLFTKDGSPAKWVLDPTLLLKRSDYDKIATKRRLLKEKYIVVYNASGRQKFLNEVAAEIRRRSNLRVISLLVYQYGLVYVNKDEKIAFGPADFLAWIRDAEAVVAISFHGTAFSLIYHKPFISILDKDRGIESRQAAILKRLGCSERMVIQGKSNGDFVSQLFIPVKESVYERLESLKVDSRRWLEGAVENISGVES